MDPTRPDRDAGPDPDLAALVAAALAEDAGRGDVTTELTVPAGAAGTAAVIAKQAGVVAGTAAASLAFASTDSMLAVSVLVADGGRVSPGGEVLRVSGRAAPILRAERTALNFLQRMSGIATLTAEFVRRVEGTGAKITDTRKTAPGLRVADRLAVRAGGGVNHRFGLHDMVLIKDNHIAAAGGIAEAVRRCAGKTDLRIEVETRDEAGVEEALRSPGVDRIMLDNFSVTAMAAAMRLVQAARRGGARVEIEASGNVTLDNVAEIAATGVDVISVGALTHSAPALDLSLRFRPETPAR